jgi:hypothetical protein
LIIPTPISRSSIDKPHASILSSLALFRSGEPSFLELDSDSRITTLTTRFLSACFRSWALSPSFPWPLKKLCEGLSLPFNRTGHFFLFSSKTELCSGKVLKGKPLALQVREDIKGGKVLPFFIREGKVLSSGF